MSFKYDVEEMELVGIPFKDGIEEMEEVFRE